MSKLTKKAVRYGRFGRTLGRTDPNYRKALLLKMCNLLTLLHLFASSVLTKSLQI